MRWVGINLREGRELSLGLAMKLLEEFSWGLIIHDICLGHGFDFCLGIYFLRMLLGVGPYQLGVEPRPLGEANFDDCFAWGLAWGGFAWGCEAGVYLEISTRTSVREHTK